MVPRRNWENWDYHCQAIVHCWLFGLSEHDRRFWMGQKSSERYLCILCIRFKNQMDQVHYSYVEISCELSRAILGAGENTCILYDVKIGTMHYINIFHCIHLIVLSMYTYGSSKPENLKPVSKLQSVI